MKNIVSPDIPHPSAHTKSDCNEFLHHFVNMFAAIKSSISPSNCQYHACNLLTSDTWSCFVPVTLQGINDLLSRLKLTSFS